MLTCTKCKKDMARNLSDLNYPVVAGKEYTLCRECFHAFEGNRRAFFLKFELKLNKAFGRWFKKWLKEGSDTEGTSSQ